MNEPCRSLEDIEYQAANGIGNPLWQIEVLCAEIRNLQRQIAALRKQDNPIMESDGGIQNGASRTTGGWIGHPA